MFIIILTTNKLKYIINFLQNISNIDIFVKMFRTDIEKERITNENSYQDGKKD